MRARRLSAMVALLAASSCARCRTPPPPPSVINGHPVRLDAEKKLVPWSTSAAPFAEVPRLAWGAMKREFPVQPNGLRTFYAYSRFDPDTFEGISWPHNPAGLNAMLVESAIGWHAYSGDRDVLTLVEGTLDYQLQNGTTPATWDWASVPFSSADPGAIRYVGADDDWCEGCGRGDGPGVLEPDKVGELGFGYLRFYEATGAPRFRDAAVACADALARHVRDGDESRSPWPFRVVARSGAVREEYTANVLGAIQLFDELARLELGDVPSYMRARETAWRWLASYPMENDKWSAYFEDIPVYDDPGENVNQYIALQTARWLLEHPAEDPEWRAKVTHILKWALEVFGADANNERGVQYGANVMSEQMADMAKMASHTARYAAVNALLYEKTGDGELRERAWRSLSWATYMCSERGVVAVGEDKNEGYWFTDGYGDYIRQFLVALAAIPEWNDPAEDHLLRSTSIVRSVAYDPGRTSYEVFDARGTETLSLRYRPTRSTCGTIAVRALAPPPGQGYLVTVTRDGCASVTLE